MIDFIKLTRFHYSAILSLTLAFNYIVSSLLAINDKAHKNR